VSAGGGVVVAEVAVARRLLAATRRLVADPTNAQLVARLLAWSVRPRNAPDALRRQLRDTDPEAAARDPAGALSSLLPRRLDGPTTRAAAAVAERWLELGCRLVVLGDPGYPARLAEGWPHSDAPSLLALRHAPGPEPATHPSGDQPMAGALGSDRASVAIVGARHATSYGTGVAAWLAEAVAAAGVRVVSGGALGIDAAAHRAALEGPGGTTVVLGCGHGVGYPRPHARSGGLFEQVVASGGATVSELLPEQPPRAGVVRARNRLVAGLADVTVVVEGGPRSGALLTAGAAAERGRPVMAVPGDVRAPGSAAPHRLLADGAAPCTAPADLLATLGTAVGRTGQDPTGPAAARLAAPSALPDTVYAVLARRWPRPIQLDELVEETGRSVPALLAAVTRAQVAGELTDDAEGVRLRRAPDGRA
jgi:DNA processing protein